MLYKFLYFHYHPFIVEINFLYFSVACLYEPTPFGLQQYIIVYPTQLEYREAG